MSGVFRNLVSRDRDKKEFFFYDKFVPFFPACDIDYIEFITPTVTPTMTQTPTPTSSVTPTPTNTPTQTPNPTNTPTQTSTPTNTPTQTSTPTNTPTNTMTPTPTPTTPSVDDFYMFRINTTLTNGSFTGTTSQFRSPTVILSGGFLNIDWGDGNISTGLTSQTLHTYSTPGIYDIKLYPDPTYKIRQIKQHVGSNPGQTDTSFKVTDVLSWGSNVTQWNDFDRHFYNMNNLISIPITAPVLTGVTTLNLTFGFCTLFNQDISSWDVSNISNMRGTFISCSLFNQPLNSWDVSNVTDMFWMFNNASSFNQPLNSWDVSNVTDMRDMFISTPFNQNISGWTVTNVTEMSFMFAFSQFNQNIGNWNTSNVIDMEYMFANSSFNQNIGNWNISSLTNATGMMDNSSLSTTNYNNLLIGWAAQAPNINYNVTFGAQGRNYTSAAASARNTLTGVTYSWNITDAGQI